MYVPEESIEWHVRRIVTKLIGDDTRYDAHRIVSIVMRTIPEHKLGSITNRSIAAAAIWNGCRVCSLYREDGVPAWTQWDIGIAAGVTDYTIRKIARRLQEMSM